MMCRYRDRNDEGYNKVKGVVSKYMDEIQTQVAKDLDRTQWNIFDFQETRDLKRARTRTETEIARRKFVKLVHPPAPQDLFTYSYLEAAKDQAST